MIRCRSMLFVPGNKIEQYIAKAVAANPDILVLDAEDSVPGQHAVEATRNILATLRSDPFPRSMTVAVRLRSEAQASLFGPAFHRPPHFVIPKATYASVLRHKGDGGLFPIIESAQGVLEAVAIASIPGVRGLLYGPQDLAAEMRRREWGSLPGSETVLLAAKCHKRVAILGCPGDCNAWAEGWDGVVCLSPIEVDYANDRYRPSHKDVEWARRVLEEERRTGGAPSKTDDGILCGAPVYKQAKAILDLHEFYEAADVRQK